MKSKSTAYIFVITVLLLLHILFLFYIKYSNQNLSLAGFKLGCSGNIISFIIFLMITIGLYRISKNQFKLLSKKTVSWFIISIYFLLIFSFLISQIRLPLRSVYILNQPGDKIIVAISFMFYQLIVFLFLSAVWTTTISKSKYKFTRSMIGAIIIYAFFFVFAAIFIEQNSLSDKEHVLNKKTGNIAVVLGAAVWSTNKPSPTLAARVDKSIELYRKKFVSRIIFTGSNAPGELSEAAVAYNYAKQMGVRPDFIEVEENTTSTNEQIAFIKNNISGRDYISDIILISDSYHLPRILEISSFYDVDIKVASSHHKMSFDDLFYNKLRESFALVIFWFFAL